MRAQLASCQAILLMSDFEGLPMALLEAMAIGVVPVARTIRSGIPELVQDNRTGLLVDGQPANAAAAILKLADDPALWTECAHGARKLVEDRFSEDSAYFKWVALLDQLCARCNICYPIVTTRDLQLQGVHPIIAQHYPRPASLGTRVRGRLGIAARRARRLVSGK